MRFFLTIQNTDFASYAGDNTPYTTSACVNDVVDKLEKTANDMFNWFSENEMKANTDKCHLILNCSDRKQIKINNENIKSSNYEKLLGIQIDKKLTFHKHVGGLCKKASQKMHALARITPYMSIKKNLCL